jgi:hypothetical protein
MAIKRFGSVSSGFEAVGPKSAAQARKQVGPGFPPAAKSSYKEAWSNKLPR